MKIRKAKEDDKEKILELLNSEPATLEENEMPYDEECAEEYIKGKSFETFVCEISGEIAGVVIAHVRRIGRYAELYNLVVNKKYRKKGIGIRLMNFMEEHLRKFNIEEMFLYTLYNNDAMQKLSNKLKYKKGKKFLTYSKVLIKRK
ncbi:MAG: GNAT family N-acetyltransferase [Nanoarchaeota archaeon]